MDGRAQGLMDAGQVSLRRLTRAAGLLLALLLALAVPLSAWAQDEAPAATPTPEPRYFDPQEVETRAADDLRLRGDFFLVDAGRPTVLLLHEMYTNRKSWRPLIGLLLGADYNVLAVDIRSMGATRGRVNWDAAVEDVAAWLVWLREVADVRGDAISIMGSSMGSSLALLGCANDSECRTAIALSPGWAYYGLEVEPAFEALGERPALILYAANDRWPKQGVPQMAEVASAAVEIEELAGNLHGMGLLSAEHRVLVPRILDWLAAHGS